MARASSARREVLMHPLLENTLEKIDAEIYLNDASTKVAAYSIAQELTQEILQTKIERLPRLGFIYEVEGLMLYANKDPKDDRNKSEDYIRYFELSYNCWRSLAYLSLSNGETSFPNSEGLKQFASDIYYNGLSSDLALAFHLAVTGIVSNNTSNVRLELTKIKLDDSSSGDWKTRIIEGVIKAFLLLCRKSNGWDDINLASRIIEKLRALQAQFEENYLNQLDSREDQTIAATNLVGFYHLAQIITLTYSYLYDAKVAFNKLKLQIERHSEQAKKIFSYSKSSAEIHLSDLIKIGALTLVQNAIWTHVTHLGKNLNSFAQYIAGKDKSDPVIELWPSQQEALRENLLDPYMKAILVEMPTSSGKTLLAKFSIIQTLSLNPDGTIAYVVPTRALVNQITREFRKDFANLNLTIEMAVPSYEINPTESALLSQKPNILIVTPEKLDLLIKSSHPCVDTLSLIVADEAHNLGDDSPRAARLELLLGTIQREKPAAKFLLLSPFLPNGEEIVIWLGNEKALPPIKIDWKPNKKLIGAIYNKGKKEKRRFQFELLPSADNFHINDKKLSISLGASNQKTSIQDITKETVKTLHKDGTILVLCRGKTTSEKRAKQISEVMPTINKTELLEATINFIESEIGEDTNLVKCLLNGVAFHHAGMSQELRWLVERLISHKVIKVICGTTTLAQGMNFPIRTVIVETLLKGNNILSYEEFWNIAGRAGRALYDTVGIVGFPFSNSKQREKAKKYLEGEASEITSYLTTLISNIEKIGDNFDLKTVRNWPQLAELMKYLAHAMRVSGAEHIADELDEILRGSFAYYKLEINQKELANSFFELCTRYLNDLSSNENKKKILPLADKTGFTTPSILSLLGEISRHSSFKNANSWEPSFIFGEDINPLKERIEVIGNLPEMQLSDGTHGEFDPNRIALILRDWVNGESISVLAGKYDISGSEDINSKITRFSGYLYGNLLSNASWGIGALSGVCLKEEELKENEDFNYLSSMIYFGVKSKEAVWFRMAGAPRIFANELGNLWLKKNGTHQPGSYSEMRNWISGLNDEDWSNVSPKNSKLNSQQLKLLWNEFSG